ncbi:MAG: hypothetical protein ACE5FA_13785 [Dehalococcoidia bacterium]
MSRRKRSRRPVYYNVTSMNDGAVLSAYPVRKTAARIMKRDGDRLDEDNVCKDFTGSFVGSFKFDDSGRFRFFDIMANRLNMRRAIREVALPKLEAVEAEVAALRIEISDLKAMLFEDAAT